MMKVKQSWFKWQVAIWLGGVVYRVCWISNIASHEIEFLRRERSNWKHLIWKLWFCKQQ